MEQVESVEGVHEEVTGDPSLNITEKAAEDPPTTAKKTKKVKPMAVKKKVTKSNGVKATKKNGSAEKIGLNVSGEVGRKIRQLRAQMELEAGDRITISDAIDKAVSAVLK